MTNEQIASMFRRIALLLEMRDEPWTRVRAYHNAADVIDDLKTPLADMAAVGGGARLRELPGIGAHLSERILEILRTGSCGVYEELKREIPETVLDLLQVEGVGIVTARTLYDMFRVGNLDDFVLFARGGGLASVPRLGEKTQARIRASLEKLCGQTETAAGEEEGPGDGATEGIDFS
ncbi:MAG: helix-hairpin-helix domain-containing protein [Blastocatellia bacterium]